jgi:hypothetical protein
MKVKNYAAAIVLITAWVLVGVSYYLELRWGNSLFSRSGSMMVLVTVVAKQMLLKGRNKYHHQQLRMLANGKQANLDKVHPTKSHQYFEIFANTNILLGTLIWGYGDLLL